MKITDCLLQTTSDLRPCDLEATSCRFLLLFGSRGSLDLGSHRVGLRSSVYRPCIGHSATCNIVLEVELPFPLLSTIVLLNFSTTGSVFPAFPKEGSLEGMGKVPLKHGWREVSFGGSYGLSGLLQRYISQPFETCCFCSTKIKLEPTICKLQCSGECIRIPVYGPGGYGLWGGGNQMLGRRAAEHLRQPGICRGGGAPSRKKN